MSQCYQVAGVFGISWNSLSLEHCSGVVTKNDTNEVGLQPASMLNNHGLAVKMASSSSFLQLSTSSEMKIEVGKTASSPAITLLEEKI